MRHFRNGWYLGQTFRTASHTKSLKAFLIDKENQPLVFRYNTFRFMLLISAWRSGSYAPQIINSITEMSFIRVRARWRAMDAGATCASPRSRRQLGRGSRSQLQRSQQHFQPRQTSRHSAAYAVDGVNANASRPFCSDGTGPGEWMESPRNAHAGTNAASP